MELNKIEMLLEKYEEGNTSIQEERFLRDYFTSQNIPPHLHEHKIMFQYMAAEGKETYPLEVKLSSGNKQKGYVGIAASIIIALGLFIAVYNQPVEPQQQQLGTIEDPEEVYLQAKATLQMVSQVLNAGAEELSYIDEFSRVKNKYIKE